MVGIIIISFINIVVFSLIVYKVIQYFPTDEAKNGRTAISFDSFKAFYDCTPQLFSLEPTYVILSTNYYYSIDSGKIKKSNTKCLGADLAFHEYYYYFKTFGDLNKYRKFKKTIEESRISENQAKELLILTKTVQDEINKITDNLSNLKIDVNETIQF